MIIFRASSLKSGNVPREGRTFSRVAVVGVIVALRCNTKADCVVT